MVILVGLEVVKLETDELPHFSSETQTLPLGTVMKRVQRLSCF